MPRQRRQFTRNFLGKVFAFKIDYLVKVYWLWDKYSPLIVCCLCSLCCPVVLCGEFMLSLYCCLVMVC
jgi:hypothetical protein